MRYENMSKISFVHGLDQDRHPVPDPNSKFADSVLCDYQTMSDLARRSEEKPSSQWIVTGRSSQKSAPAEVPVRVL